MATLTFEYPREKRTARELLLYAIGDYLTAATQATPLGLQLSAERLEGTGILKITGNAESMNWLLAKATENHIAFLWIDTDDDGEFISMMLRNGTLLINRMTWKGQGMFDRERIKKLEQIQERMDHDTAGDDTERPGAAVD